MQCHEPHTHTAQSCLLSKMSASLSKVRLILLLLPPISASSCTKSSPPLLEPPYLQLKVVPGVYSVQCTVYSVQCTVYSEQCTVYSVYSTAGRTCQSCRCRRHRGGPRTLCAHTCRQNISWIFNKKIQIFYNKVYYLGSGSSGNLGQKAFKSRLLNYWQGLQVR